MRQYQNYRSIERSAGYIDSVANELKKMSNETAVQMKNRRFTGEDPVSVIAFLQDFRAFCDAATFMKVLLCGSSSNI